MRRGPTRRGFLRAGATAATALAAGTGVAAGQSTDYGGWFTSSAKGGEVKNYDGTTVDKTGQDTVTVEVGAQGNGGTYAYAPPAVRVSPGTEVVFEWTSNTHNIVVEDQPSGANWEGVSEIKNSGYSYSHTFETAGVYKYYCDPHLGLGMKGAVVVGGSGGGGGSPEWGDWFTSSAKGGEVKNYDGTTVDKTGQSDVTVEVGADGNGGTYAYAPPALKIDPGTTVHFEWTSDTHNIVVEEQPSGADWSGVSAIENSGYTYSYTFETSGTYLYYCDPHLGLGMKAGIFVTGSSGGGGAAAGGGGGLLPDLNWWNAAWMVGPSAVAVPAIAAYVLWDSWRAGDVSLDWLLEGEAPPETVEAPQYEPKRRIEHDDYDPWGTASLIAVYTAILVVAWILLYFVEFLGRGPHILG